MDPLSLAMTISACRALENTMVPKEVTWSDPELMLLAYRQAALRQREDVAEPEGLHGSGDRAQIVTSPRNLHVAVGARDGSDRVSVGEPDAFSIPPLSGGSPCTTSLSSP